MLCCVMLYNMCRVMLYNKSCYMTCVMLYNICYVIDMCHVINQMLCYMTCHVI